MSARRSDLDYVAQAIGRHRFALMAYGDDLSLDDARRINDTTGFEFDRDGGETGRWVRVSAYHLTDAQLALAYLRSAQYLDS